MDLYSGGCLLHGAPVEHSSNGMPSQRKEEGESPYAGFQKGLFGGGESSWDLLGNYGPQSLYSRFPTKPKDLKGLEGPKIYPSQCPSGATWGFCSIKGKGLGLGFRA